MRKLVYIFLILGLVLNAQTINSQVEKEPWEKTIIDYGAKWYKTKEEALKGKESSHDAIRKMVNDVGTALLPCSGWFYIDHSTTLFRTRDAIYSKCKGIEYYSIGNKGVNIITDKPIDMFVITNEEQEVSGFTAWYVGPDIKQCAAVRIGGNPSNIGAEYKNEFLNSTIPHFRPRRTNAFGIKVDIDFVGDQRFAKRVDHTDRKDNPNFIENYGAHAVWVNYDEENENQHSHFHFANIRGYFKYVNTGIKIDRRPGSKQSLNTFDIDLKIFGARKFADIKGVNFGSIKIIGQEKYMTDDSVDLFNVQGGTMRSDIWIYDVGGRREGIYKVKDLELFGLSKLRLYERNGIKKLPNTNLAQSTLKND